MKHFLIYTFFLATLVQAGPQPKSPASNAKDTGTMKEFHSRLKKEGWHRKEASRITDELTNTFGDEIVRPLPNLNNHIYKMIHNYQVKYNKFQNTFVGATKHSNRLIRPSLKRGVWSHIEMNPTAGRVYDLELNPSKPNEMYANPDGDGIFFTKNGGKHWRSITDSIPNRLDRDAYENIIVDPKNFNHVFSISHFGNLYETKNRGKNWHKIKNTKHKDGKAPQFKWVEAFRDSKNNLILIGTVTKSSGMNGGWQAGCYRSADRGLTWNLVDIQTKQKLQEMAFHRQKKDVVYLAGQSKIYISTNAGLNFKLLKDFKTGDRPMFITTLYGKQANGIYAAISTGNDTRVTFSKNMGKKWTIRQDSGKKKGYNKGIFGNSGSSGWTSFFEVDPFDSNHLIASSVGSCESFDGGVTWEYLSWGIRAKAVMADGSIAMSPHGGHNADNHCVKFHPKLKGFYVKGCDAGIMKRTKEEPKAWTNINGDMPAFLWYSIIINEFGDRYLAGNTQDVNIQTNRYDFWENDNGYEGDTIFINPYTNIAYYPTVKTADNEGIGFLEKGFWKMQSWGMPRTGINYYNSNQLYISFGRRPTEPERALPKYLYVTNDRGMNFKRVPNMKDQEVFLTNVSRTKAQVLTAFTEKSVMTTVNNGKDWQTQPFPEYIRSCGSTLKVSGAVNPEKPEQMWVGGNNGKIATSNDGGKNWTDISGSLPKGPVSALVFHEGTAGDLYALVNGFGVFYKSSEAKDWVLWMDGFNLKDFREIRIDYPNQRLVAASYGRGAWECLLMKPCERFYKKGFKLKQLNSISGLQTFTVDSKLITPDYYNYHWYINKKRVGGNTDTLTTSLAKAGAHVQLKISPRFTKSIATTSSPLKVKTLGRKLNFKKRNSLKVDQNYLDLGNVELFGARQNYSVDLRVKPSAPGVLVGNRRLFARDAKGWLIQLKKDGHLEVLLTAKQNRNLTRTFGEKPEQALRITSKSPIKMNEWTNVTLTVNRKGEAVLYVNGKAAGSVKMKLDEYALSLNNVMNLNLMADAFGNHQTKGELQHLKIWNRALEAKEIEKTINKSSLTKGLVYFINSYGQKVIEQIRKHKFKLTNSPQNYNQK
ncbi:MAG: hypothetical protein KAG98_01635 [Lentisphaeria bacterium]|nr:hypothetical protein [Lentisphaeria bacterium]